MSQNPCFRIVRTTSAKLNHFGRHHPINTDSGIPRTCYLSWHCFSCSSLTVGDLHTLPLLSQANVATDYARSVSYSPTRLNDEYQPFTMNQSDSLVQINLVILCKVRRNLTCQRSWQRHSSWSLGYGTGLSALW